jgi:hypothetical protein
MTGFEDHIQLGILLGIGEEPPQVNLVQKGAQQGEALEEGKPSLSRHRLEKTLALGKIQGTG